MKTKYFFQTFFSIIIIISLCCCDKPIDLPGNISGYVTDANSSEPLDSALIELNQSSSTIDTTLTENDGSYLLKNLDDGIYEIQASKPAYTTITKNITVISANTIEVDFEMRKAPYPEFSDTSLFFGAVSTVESFTISNAGTGELRYSLSSTKGWITIDPNEGEVTTETDTIKVSIDRTGFSKEKQMEKINIVSYGGENEVHDHVAVYVNGAFDQEGYYFGIVAIGTQIWMSENVNRGNMIDFTEGADLYNNGVIEKFCYDNLVENCETYGGIYSWSEMMDYNPMDTGIIGITQGICPDGYHIPTYYEWFALRDFLGGWEVAGGPLKATGTLQDGTGLWESPNEGATNETGFTALPGGWADWDWDDQIYPQGFFYIGFKCEFWNASKGRAVLGSAYEGMGAGITDPYFEESIGEYVRCIKDP